MHPLRYGLAALLFFACGIAAFGQAERKHLREGNDHYRNQDYGQALQSYQKGLEANPASKESAFNIGNALYKSGKYEEAAQQFGQLGQTGNDNALRAKALHNLGNSFLESKKYKESIDAYKEALRINPKDEDTRYNLAYAMKKLQEQQNQNQQQQQQNQNQQQQNENEQQQQQNQDQNQQQNQDQNQQQQNPNQQQQQQQGQPPQRQGISKEDAERMLKALQSQEQDLHDRIKKQKGKGQPAKVEKDW